MSCMSRYQELPNRKQCNGGSIEKRDFWVPTPGIDPEVVKVGMQVLIKSSRRKAIVDDVLPDKYILCSYKETKPAERGAGVKTTVEGITTLDGKEIIYPNEL